MPISPCSGAGQVQNVSKVWVDVELRAVGQSVLILPKNPNREWLHNLGLERSRTTFIPWAGKPPMAFAVLKGILMGKAGRGQALGLDDFLVAHRILEDLLELSLIGYPYRILRALAHSIPCNPPAQIVRRTVRAWKASQPAAEMDSKGEEQHQDCRFRGTPGKARRRSRTSSSSAPSPHAGRRTERKVEKAKRLLQSAYPEYRQWQLEAAMTERERQLQARSMALANAMQGTFQPALIQSAMLPAPAFPPSAPERLPTGSPQAAEIPAPGRPLA